jgi:hypothetical protein
MEHGIHGCAHFTEVTNTEAFLFAYSNEKDSLVYGV